MRERGERGRPAAEEHGLEPLGEHPALELELLQEGVYVPDVLPGPADHGDEVAVTATMRAERQMDVQMPSPARHALTRLGRGTSSPPQFGQTSSIPSAHGRQKVHSYEQMNTSSSSAREASHRSHFVRISSAISSSALA